MSTERSPVHSIPASTTVLEQAAEWFAHFDGDPDSADAQSNEQRQAFRRWLKEPEHAQAWQELQHTWARLGSAKRPGSAHALERAEKQAKRDRRKLLLGGGSGVLLLLLSVVSYQWFGSGLSQPNYLLADHVTWRGEYEQRVLADGSRLHLNSATAVKIDFEVSRRQIELLEGELFIEVAADPQRPLTIVTEQGSATALGTQFAVRSRQDHETGMRVAVYESAVRACAATPEDCRNLKAGQQVSVTKAGLTRLPAVMANARPEWLQGRMNIDNQPLIQVLQSLALHHQGVLRFDAAELKDLRVSGSVPLGDIPRALQALAMSAPIEISGLGDRVLRVSRKR